MVLFSCVVNFLTAAVGGAASQYRIQFISVQFIYTTELTKQLHVVCMLAALIEIRIKHHNVSTKNKNIFVATWFIQKKYFFAEFNRTVFVIGCLTHAAIVLFLLFLSFSECSKFCPTKWCSNRLKHKHITSLTHSVLADRKINRIRISLY